MKSAGRLCVFIVPTLLMIATATRGQVLDVPGSFPTIQQAIDAAAAGDTVQLAPGVYPEAIDFLGKAITVRGAGMGASVIDATGLGSSAVVMASGETPESILENLSVRGGTGTLDAGLVLGGGIFVKGASPTIRSCEVLENTVIATNSRGGGVAAYGTGVLTLEDCHIHHNNAGGHGGGVFVQLGTLMMTDCIVELNNSSTAGIFRGGGVGIFSAAGQSLVRGSTVHGNKTLIGGGIYSDSSISVEDSVIDGNGAKKSGGLGVTGPGPNTFLRCTIKNNHNNGWNGQCTSGLYGCYGNAAGAGIGGFDNTFVNCTFFGNSSNHFGGALNTVGSTALSNGIGYGSASLRNCIVWGNSAGFTIMEGTWSATYSDIQSGVASGAGNISADPLFADAAAGSFCLGAASPCRDSGDPAEPLDADLTITDMGTLGYSLACEPAWSDVGYALAGVAGEPVLMGSGPLTAGSTGALTLTNAASSAASVLFVATGSTPAPFKGGMLAAFPFITTLPLATSLLGNISLTFASWPAGLSGVALYFQYAIQDGGAVQGVALSNALKADVP